MARRRKSRSRIYLAGPIAGCNEEQKTAWRAEVVDAWKHEFEFLDPSEQPRGESAFEIVRGDLAAIARADAILANMWRESVGTAIGIAHARREGKIIVLADPNRIQSRVLTYYVDAVVSSHMQAMKVIRNLLRAEERLGRVLKHSGKLEPFQRGKLMQSIRGACRSAGRNNVLAPASIAPRVMEQLATRRQVKGALPSKAIRDTVWNVLQELEADPLRADEFAGIREAWEQHEQAASGNAPRRPVSDNAVVVHRSPGRVRVHSYKSHATIWGKAVKGLGDIPQPARGLFTQICCVDGVATVRLGRFGTGAAGKQVSAQLFASRSRGVIEGKCFHSAPKGHMQTFQVLVQRPERTDAIRRRMIEHLHERGYVRSGLLSEDKGEGGIQ